MCHGRMWPAGPDTVRRPRAVGSVDVDVDIDVVMMMDVVNPVPHPVIIAGIVPRSTRYGTTADDKNTCYEQELPDHFPLPASSIVDLTADIEFIIAINSSS
jgi:hypothetical protein